MRYRPLGHTGIHVSAVGLGGNQFGTTCNATQTAAIVHRALDLGVNFIDSADMYGEGASEETLGKALAGRWHEVVLASKTGAGDEPGKLSRKRVAERLDASLRRLGSDHIDLYYLHFPDAATPLEETLRAMEDAVRAGKIRYVGISNHPAWQVAEAAGIARRNGWSPVAASQVRYNLLDRAPEAEMIPACAHLGVSLVPYSPLGSSFLTGKYAPDAPPPADSRFGRNARAGDRYMRPEHFASLGRYRAFAERRGHSVAELAVAWLLSQPVVCSVIAGATRPEQVAANAQAAEWVLGADEVRELA
jgi:aryl-alcohol dehydrogenase-like predicted oxidoreductase